jgi:ubiquinone/menaquinone biosynthesis C-methylase UbiE
MSTLTPDSLVSFSLDSPHLAEQYDALSDLQFENGRRLALDLDIRSGHRILDVGAGTGRLAEHLAGLAGGPEYIAAIDPLPDRIALARRRLGDAARLTVGRAEDLSAFPDNSFQHVIFNAVFHWIPDQPAALREAARVLNAGGRIGITTGDRHRSNAFQGAVERVLARPGFQDLSPVDWLPYRVSPEQLRSLLESAGFEQELLVSRSFTDYYAQAEDIFAFNRSSSFGNFLKELPPQRAEAARLAIAQELEALRGDRGIALQRHTIFSVAIKR